jgi:hypothetical protein
MVVAPCLYPHKRDCLVAQKRPKVLGRVSASSLFFLIQLLIDLRFFQA